MPRAVLAAVPAVLLGAGCAKTPAPDPGPDREGDGILEEIVVRRPREVAGRKPLRRA